MSKTPDLVFDEQMATGWVRTELYGDSDKATGLILAARAQLGGMRTMYGVNQRIAEGEPGGFYHASNILPDGSVIQTLTNDGHDTIRIWATGGSPQPKRRRPNDLKLVDMLICGTCREDTGVAHAVLWSGGGDPLDLGRLEVCKNAEATDISEDGQTVVGFGLLNGSFSSYAAWYWNAAEGMVEIGPLNPNVVDMRATSVSADGSVIVGVGYGNSADYGPTGWLWRSGMGFLELPNAGLGMPSSQLVKISPDGTRIAGVIYTPLVNNVNTDGAFWAYDAERHQVSEHTLIPRPGTATSTPQGAGQTTEDYPDISAPSNITDAGVISGATNHKAFFAYVTTSGIDGIDFAPATYYTNTLQTTGSAFRYDPVTQDYVILGDGTPVAEADDTGVVAGNQINGDWTAFRNDYTIGDMPAYTTGYEYRNIVQNGWLLAVVENIVEVQSLGANTLAHDISEDGTAVVGEAIDTAGNNLNQPLLWLDDGTTTQLDLPDGCVSGAATAVAFATSLEMTSEEEF